MKNNPAKLLNAVIRNYYRLFFTAALSSICLLQACAQNVTRPTRANSVFGVHFDFHANPEDNQIGQTLTQDMVEKFLTTVKPDFIQIDTKGHTGIASYPTKVGRSGGIVKDPIKLFRQITAKHGVGLYAHYSSIGDVEVLKDHPEWAAIDESGKRSKNLVSIFSGYVDNYFIPQLKEISDYGVDGFWIDGDNWMLQPDYSAVGEKEYKTATGKRIAGRSDNDKKDHLQFTRKAYRKYLNHYVTAMHKYNPKLQIGSSWAYAARMPGPVDAPVDFLSGDIPSNDIAEIDFHAYSIASQGKTWDIMSWAVPVDNERFKYSFKSDLQLKQQAAIALSLGGAHQVYVPQNHDASLPMDSKLLQTLKSVSDFCHTMKPYSFKTKAIPQVGLFLSSTSHYRESNLAFGSDDRGSTFFKGTLDMILDAQYSVEILQEHNIRTKAKEYPLIVIPEWRYITPAIANEFKQYVKNGGKLLIIGSAANQQILQGLPGGKTYENPAELSIKSYNYGSGIIVSAVPAVAAKELMQRLGAVKKTVKTIVKRMYPDPLVSIEGGEQLHVNTVTKNGDTMVNLVNVSQIYPTGGRLPNTIKPTGTLSITLRTDKKPASIKLQPENESINFTYSNGIAKFTIPGVNLYSVIQVK